MICLFCNSIQFGPVNFYDEEVIKDNPDVERPVKEKPEECLTEEIQGQYIFELVVEALKICMQYNQKLGNGI